ncbi:uncharacterized protein LOC143038455 [Oratosquilla oratoria]|uniref:uncharacterized protein LOC143038455 n=1 Tax=Oratosquilla oratoria TaxID=337810 RepID=UPI003F76B67F
MNSIVSIISFLLLVGPYCKGYEIICDGKTVVITCNAQASRSLSDLCNGNYNLSITDGFQPRVTRRRRERNFFDVCCRESCDCGQISELCNNGTTTASSFTTEVSS